jgi:hypothetical protein
MSRSVSTSTGMHYEIKIIGELDERWSNWFNGVMISSLRSDDIIPETTITVLVPDQARLRGVLNKIWDLNLTLISIRQINVDNDKEEGND